MDEVCMKLEKALGKVLAARALSLATAESCTGGLIARRITDVSGASGYFEGGFVTYSNRAKTLLIGVPAGLIERHGAVSAETATAMARGAMNKLKADVAVAVTGIAGPTGGTPDKPVGTVFIAVATKAKTSVRRYHFTGTRSKIRKHSADEALALVLDHLEGRVEK